MSDSRSANPSLRPREAPPFTSDPRDEYVFRVVSFVFGALAGALILAGAAVVVLSLMLVDSSGPGTPIAIKVSMIVGGLWVLTGIGVAIASMSLPTPDRKYRSPR